MKQRFFHLIKLFGLFLAFFILSKIIFLAYYWNLTFEAGLLQSLKVFWHGLRLDISAASYLILLPTLILFISSILKIDLYTIFVKWYIWIVAIVCSLILVADLELYSYWGFRLDVTPLLYLKTPKEAMASVSLWVILGQLVFAAVLVATIIYVFKLTINENTDKPFNKVEILLYLFLLGFLIIPIRGGLGIAPLNVGSAYFSQKSFLNHASINVYWNLAFSMSNKENEDKKYRYFEDKSGDNFVRPYLNNNDTTGIHYIKSGKPNVVLIMMESFTANVIQTLGGLDSITPCFNKLSNEGILFTNFYSAGDRSDKGLMAILSGYPAQTTYSVIKDAAKTQSMPKLPLDLKSEGYNTAFYYGGDINFANMRSYLVSAGFEDIISKDDFPSSSYNSKWGAHDEVVFDKLQTDLKVARAPFFKMLFTLSSHEPFEVPGKVVIKGDDLSSKFLNSVHYTDSCLGKFIRQAKQELWWNNTWIIIVADHGIRFPGNLKGHVPEKFHIPMLWTGGAVDKQFKVHKTASQVDIPFTVLNQLRLDGSKYMFSRNLFGEKQHTDAFYIFNNGIGLVNDSTSLVFDCTLKSVLEKKGPISDSLVNASKAYIQTVYSDIKNRK